MTNVPKIVCERTINGVDYLLNVTTPPGNQGFYAITIVQPGNKFWYWDSIPAGQIIACDFTDAPTCTADAATNNTLIAGITAAPEDVLTFAP